MVSPPREAAGGRSLTAGPEREGGPDLPRWAGITEPSTVLTNLVLAGLSFVLAARLGYAAAADRRAAALAIAAALLATSMSAALGACAHAADPLVMPGRRMICWRASLHVIGLVSAATVASIAFFAARGPVRTA